MMLTDVEMHLSGEERRNLLADEFLLIRNSGEIPEVALHSSLYYLIEDPAGPRITLAADDLAVLKDAVQERYLEIILRDLDPENRDKGHFRGLARCVANWGRLSKFCDQEGRDIERIRGQVASALRRFIAQELRDVRSDRRISCVNCSTEELRQLVADLGLADEDLLDGWQCLCG